jgi:hypothetical protein
VFPCGPVRPEDRCDEVLCLINEQQRIQVRRRNISNTTTENDAKDNRINVYPVGSGHHSCSLDVVNDVGDCVIENDVKCSLVILGIKDDAFEWGMTSISDYYFFT